MSSTAELKKVKLNVNNIRSVLLDGKKAVDEKKKDREDFLQKLAEEKKQKQEEKGLEQAIKPTQKKPDLKSPVKSSMGLMDRVFNFVGAIVGGIIVKALPEIIDAVKKIMKEVKPIFEKIVEGLKPVFNFIGDLFKDKGSYDSEKEKVNTNIEEANLIGKDIDTQGTELTKAGEDVANENKGLAANSDALGKEEKGLQEDPEERDDDDSEDNTENNEDAEDNSSNSFLESIENAPPPPPEVLQQQEEAGERMTAINDAFFKLQAGTITQAQYDEIVAKNKQSKEVSVLTAPVAPNREDFPKTKEGMKAYLTAYKTYNIQRKEFKKQQKSLIQPSESNKNSLNALNTTDGLTSANGSGSTTVVYQRQVVEVAVPVPV